MKKVYICHEFGGVYENAKEIVKYIKQLSKINSDNLYISPVLLFGFLYDDISYDKSIDYCYEILKDCDHMITFGDESNSTGCLLEKEFCKNNNIKIIDFYSLLK